MSVLEKIETSADVKKLKSEELPVLCRELREFEIRAVSRTGGHLASNLGAVELTVALHRVYDSRRDRIVFDVGHQSYAHKILTGRREQFSSLRQHGGLSGFPKPREAEDDAFIAGHASDSVSVALGMARARSLLGEDYDVCAVIGDGALTGGLAFEGLSNAAQSREPLVIILNDNNMSISRNVGGIASSLQQMRIRDGYIRFKRWYRAVFRKMPALYRFNHSIKEFLKKKLLPPSTFSSMGFDYLGPVDGHDPEQLETVIGWARDNRCPTIVHVLTRKGKGCPYAEAEPEVYHGVGPFDPVTGQCEPCGRSFSDCFGEELCRLAAEEPRLVAGTAAMAAGTGLGSFAAAYPQRFFDAGIAEGHAVSMAAGMAKQGMIPVFAVYSSFLQRGYDMLIHDVSLLGLHCVFGVDRAGLVGADGETHHGLFDLAYLKSVPGMRIYAPASFAELRAMLRKAVTEESGPVAVRYPRGGEGAYTECHCEAETLLREGSDLTLVSYGVLINEMLQAAALLAERGISAEVIKLGQLRDNPLEKTLASLRKTGKLLAAEEVCAAGCMGQELLTRSAVEGVALSGARLINLGDGIIAHGRVSELRRDHGLDAAAIAENAEKLLSE